MKCLSFFIVVLCVVSLPAFAGTVSVANGQGTWQSSACQRPLAPAYIGMNGEAQADVLNTALQSFNAFVQATQDYMHCIAQEAKADSEAASSITMMALDKQLADAQEDVNRARGQLFGNNQRSVPETSAPAAGSRAPITAPQSMLVPPLPADQQGSPLPRKRVE